MSAGFSTRGCPRSPADESPEQERGADRDPDLSDHQALQRVIYPRLFTDPEQCRIRDQQTDFPGSLMTLEFKGGKAAAFEFLRRMTIARNAVSLGGVESLACHPLTTTHSELYANRIGEAGINESMVRVSVGTEHWRDLLDDFERALQ